jgi:hypothetical protein
VASTAITYTGKQQHVFYDKDRKPIGVSLYVFATVDGTLNVFGVWPTTEEMNLFFQQFLDFNLRLRYIDIDGSDPVANRVYYGIGTTGWQDYGEDVNYAGLVTNHIRLNVDKLIRFKDRLTNVTVNFSTIPTAGATYRVVTEWDVI